MFKNNPVFQWINRTFKKEVANPINTGIENKKKPDSTNYYPVIVRKTMITDNIVKIETGRNFDETTQKMTGSLALDIENHREVEAVLFDYMEKQRYFFMIDLSNIFYIDAAGLWTLAIPTIKAFRAGRRAIFLNPTDEARKILIQTKVADKVPMTWDEEEAIAYLKCTYARGDWP